MLDAQLPGGLFSELPIDMRSMQYLRCVCVPCVYVYIYIYIYIYATYTIYIYMLDAQLPGGLFPELPVDMRSMQYLRCVCIRVGMYVCIYARICAYVYAYIYTHIKA